MKSSRKDDLIQTDNIKSGVQAFMKFLFSFLLCAALCSSCSKQQEKCDINSLSLNVLEHPPTLDPRCVRMLRDITVVKQLFDGLMRQDTQGKPQPACAETYEISQDGLTYTFHLRDTLWTNGEPVTANDFLAAWQQLLSPDFPTDYAHILYPIKNAKLVKLGKCPVEQLGAEVKDPKTLVVHLENPTPYFLELVSFPTSFPIPSKVALADDKWAYPPGDKFVCNGPFALSKWLPEETLEMKKNDSYWDKEKVMLEGLSISVCPDNNTESFLYAKGELDWLGQPLSNSISTEMISALRSEGKLCSYPVAGTFWLKFNTQKAPFDDPMLRQAFSLAICREDLITHILRGGQQSAQEILPPSMALQDKPLFEDKNLPLAQELFKKFLDKHHLTVETFPKIVLSYNTTERNLKIVQFVEEEWRKAFSIAVTLEGGELHYYRQKVKQGQFQVGTGDWIADFNDPITFLDLFKDTRENGNVMNDTGWHNEEFSQLLEKSLHEPDVKERNEMLKKAENILIAEMPVAPLYHYSYDYVKNENVKDVVLSPLGPADFKYATKRARS